MILYILFVLYYIYIVYIILYIYIVYIILYKYVFILFQNMFFILYIISGHLLQVAEPYVLSAAGCRNPYHIIYINGFHVSYI